MRILIIIFFFLLMGCSNNQKSISSQEKLETEKYLQEQKDQKELNQRISYLLHDGFTSFMIGDYSKAIERYNTIIMLNPKHIGALTGRASAKEKLGDFRGAIGDYDIAIEINPDAPNLYWQRAIIKENLKDNSGAKQDYLKILNMDITDNQSSLYYYRALVKDKFGDYHGAIQELDSNLLIILYDVKEDQVYYLRGLLKIKTGQKEEGCLDLSKAGELGNEEAYEAIRKYCN